MNWGGILLWGKSNSGRFFHLVRIIQRTETKGAALSWETHSSQEPTTKSKERQRHIYLGRVSKVRIQRNTGNLRSESRKELWMKLPTLNYWNQIHKQLTVCEKDALTEGPTCMVECAYLAVTMSLGPSSIYRREVG